MTNKIASQEKLKYTTPVLMSFKGSNSHCEKGSLATGDQYQMCDGGFDIVGFKNYCNPQGIQNPYNWRQCYANGANAGYIATCQEGIGPENVEPCGAGTGQY